MNCTEFFFAMSTTWAWRAIPYYDERHTVRPGLTVWSQVQYRYGASIGDAVRKLEYETFYLKHMSPLFDWGNNDEDRQDRLSRSPELPAQRRGAARSRISG